MLKNKKGFTIIEMLAVVAIIGILSTVLYVSYEKYVKSSREQVCKSQVLQICDAFELKMIDNINNGNRKEDEDVTIDNFTNYTDLFVLGADTYDDDYSDLYLAITSSALPEGAELTIEGTNFVYEKDGVKLTYNPVKKVFVEK